MLATREIQWAKECGERDHIDSRWAEVFISLLEDFRQGKVAWQTPTTYHLPLCHRNMPATTFAHFHGSSPPLIPPKEKKSQSEMSLTEIQSLMECSPVQSCSSDSSSSLGPSDEDSLIPPPPGDKTRTFFFFGPHLGHFGHDSTFLLGVGLFARAYGSSLLSSSEMDDACSTSSSSSDGVASLLHEISPSVASKKRGRRSCTPPAQPAVCLNERPWISFKEPSAQEEESMEPQTVPFLSLKEPCVF